MGTIAHKCQIERLACLPPGCLEFPFLLKLGRPGAHVEATRLDGDRPRPHATQPAAALPGEPPSRRQHRVLRALFHCLAACAANSLIGHVRDVAWHQTYRALEYGKARRACQAQRALTTFPPAVRRFADAFATLQKARQEADYALDGRYEKAAVQAAIDRVERTIAQFEQVDARLRRAFAAHVLFNRRPS